MINRFKRVIDDLQLAEIDLKIKKIKKILAEIALHGRKFTWCNDQRSPTMTRIDPLFASSCFPKQIYKLSPLSLGSDHCTLFLRGDFLSISSTASDEDTAPSDTNIDYKVSSFLYLHSDFWYSSLCFTCTCRYLNVGTNVSQRTSSSKLNHRFVGSPTMFHWESHNSSIRSAIEVNEHLMESLFDKLSNRSGPISISRWQGLKIIKVLCRYFCQKLHCRHGLVSHPWDPGLSGSTPQIDGEPTKKDFGRSPSWPPP
jgi:hypothetical protein